MITACHLQGEPLRYRDLETWAATRPDSLPKKGEESWQWLTTPEPFIISMGSTWRALSDWVKEHGSVHAFPLGDAFDGAEIITWPAEILIPAALGNVITVDNARDVQARIVIEAANGPTTPQAHEILLNRGVTVVPDILANAGGVTVSYFEWAQNVQRFSWEYGRVVKELEKVMRRAYRGGQGSCTGKEHRPANSCFCIGDSTSGPGGGLSHSNARRDRFPRLLTTRDRQEPERLKMGRTRQFPRRRSLFKGRERIDKLTIYFSRNGSCEKERFCTGLAQPLPAHYL